MRAFGSLIVALICLAYGIYCIRNGGTHHRGKGWLTREEAPKGFLFAMTIYFVLGLSSLLYFVYLNIK